MVVRKHTLHIRYPKLACHDESLYNAPISSFYQLCLKGHQVYRLSSPFWRKYVVADTFSWEYLYPDIYTIVWFLRAPRWYIGPTAMPRAAVTPIAPERSEGAIGCDSRPRHCKRDDIPAWRPNKITLLALLPLDLIMYYHFISFLRAVQSRVGH